jgi:hypothetical protein
LVFVFIPVLCYFWYKAGYERGISVLEENIQREGFGPDGLVNAKPSDWT